MSTPSATPEDLEPLPLPQSDWRQWLDRRVDGQLEDAAAHIGALKAESPGDTAVLQLWNDAQTAITNAFAVSSLLGAVHPSAEVMDAAEQHEVDVRRFVTDLHLDAEVYRQLASLEDAAGLDADGRRVLEDALRDFRRAGVDQDEETRARVRELDRRADELGQAFSRNIRDGRAETRVPAAALAGLPEDFRQEHPAGQDGLVAISTEYPDLHPFLTFCDDPQARRAVMETFYGIAWPANDQVLRELLDVRHEKATLLGYPDWPTYDAEVKMIGSGEAIPAFVEEISAAAAESGRRDLQVLRDRADRDGLADISVSDWRYYDEAVKRERFSVDSQETRRYFDFVKVRAGLLEVTGRLFGVAYEQIDSPAWHEDVTSYDVHLGGERIGRIHLDLHPRERKYNHAAQFDLVPGVAGRQLPEGVLVCNFPRGLMVHDHVVTLFHEFGHLLHHVLAGGHPWVRFSGVATEWDFVEAPSQMLEEWAWDAHVLRTFATDASGEPIPVDLVERMREAEEFGKGYLARTQMFYAALSYLFHRERPADLTERMFELYEEYSLFRPLPDTHFHCSFGHLEGYGSGYYTYMWSKVIAKDMFSAFDPDDLFEPGVARRYRDRVLAAGGSRPAAELVEDFLGRPYDNRAFSRWLSS